VNSSKQKLLTDNTQQTQQTDLQASCRNRTQKPSKRVAETSQLRPRDHWERTNKKY